MRNIFLLLAACAVAVPVHAQTVRTVCAAGCNYALNQIQQAVNDAQPGWIIEIAAGQTAVAPNSLVLPNKGDTGGLYVTIRSSGVTNLTPGQRVVPADAPFLARLVYTADGAKGALSSAQGAAFYRFHGIEITVEPGQNPINLIQLTTIAGGRINDHHVSQLAHHIVFDQCYIHGNPDEDGPRRGILANTGSLTVLNSWIEDIKKVDSEGTAIGGWNAAGPFYIRNNHLSSSAITTIFGGAVPNIQGLRAVGLTFLDNHYYRPWKWRSTSGTIDPGGMCLYDENGGEYYRNTSNGTYWNCVNGSWSQIPENQFSLGYFNKNQFELKNASQAWVEGNVLENGWLPTFQNQHGAAFLMNQVDNAAGISLGEPAAIVEYVWVRNNLVRNTPWGISTGQLGSYFRPMHDIFYDNNLFVNLGAEPQSLGDNRVLQTSNTGRLRFSRNTAIVDRITKGTVIGMDAAITDGMEFYGNIVGFNEGGFQNSFSGGGNLWNAFDGAWTLNRAMSKNVVVNNQHRIISGAPHPVKNIQTPSDVTGLITCASCAIPEYYENGGTNDVGFENFSAEDLRLKSTSLYGPGWGHMGKAAGADIDVVRWSTEHAEDGQSNAYLDFVVRNVSVTDSSAAISYTALDTSTCTVTTSGQPDYGNPVSTDFDTGGDQNRTVMVGGLSANTRYFYRIECGLDGYRREGVLLTLP